MNAAQLGVAADGLGPDAAWPAAADGEPVFAEPWQGRAFAMALDLVERSPLPWDDFRRQLVAAIRDEPQRPYYESWVIALERLALDIGVITDADLGLARGRAASYRFEDDVLGDVEVFPLELATVDLDDLLGAVGVGGGGGSVGSSQQPCRHAELYRTWVDGAPRAWGLRTFAADDEMLVDVALPSPFVDEGGRPTTPPAWGRLITWDALRTRFLGIGSDPADRRGASAPS